MQYIQTAIRSEELLWFFLYMKIILRYRSTNNKNVDDNAICITSSLGWFSGIINFFIVPFVGGESIPTHIIIDDVLKQTWSTDS